MRCAEAPIERIAASSGVPSGKRREEIARELRAHAEDLAASARRQGHGEDEIARMVAAEFADARRFAANFSWVYRKERAFVRLAIFGLGTATIAAAVSTAIFTAQAAAAIGFGHAPAPLASRHTAMEAADILASVAAYIGLLSIENLFASRKLPKAIALLAAISLFLVWIFALAGQRAAFLVFGCVNAVFLRSLQKFPLSGKSRLAAAMAWCAILGAVLFMVLPRPSVSLSAWLVSWSIMGAGYHLVTLLGVFIARELSARLPQP